MSRTLKFSSAAIGMVLLAGLAYYQGDTDPARAQSEILTGTVLTEAASQQESTCQDSAESAQQEPGNCPGETASDASGG